MQTSRVVPAQILPPKEGKAQYRILSNDGRVWYAFEEVANALDLNKPYDVEFVTRNFNGADYHTIKRIKSIESARLQQKQPAPEMTTQEVERRIQEALPQTGPKRLTTDRDMLMFVEALGKSTIEGSGKLWFVHEIEELVVGLKAIFYKHLGL